MKKDDAVKSIADLLAEQAQSAIDRAARMVGDRAVVTAEDIDYEQRAADLLEGALVALAFQHVCNDLTGWKGEAPTQALPPMPRA